MNLRNFTAFSLLLITALIVLVQFLVSTMVVRNGFQELEEQQLLSELRRVEKGVLQSLKNLDLFLWDWSSWDDTYQFILEGEQQYITSNLAPDTFIDQNIAAMIYRDRVGAVVYALAYSEENTPAPRLLDQLLLALEGMELPAIADSEGGRGGIVLLPQGAFMVARRDVLTTTGQGPPAGTMLMAKKISDAFVQDLAKRLGLDIRFDILQPVEAEALASSLPHRQRDARSVELGTQNNDLAKGEILLKDAHGRPAIRATVLMDRDIMHQGRKVARYNYLFLGLVVIVYSLLVYLILYRRVLSRLKNLGRQIRLFDPRAEKAIRLHMRGNDEIATLAANVNGMLRKIDDSRREIERQHERIRENESFLNQMFNSIKAGIMLVDPESRRIIDINEFGLKMMGRTREQVVGQVCHQFICPSEKNKCPILDLKQNHDFSARTLLISGEPIPIMKSVAFVQKDSRHLLLETFIDISELERARRAVEKARDDLENKVEERTRELEAANRELLALDEAKNLFLSSASHELRTPLTSIMGFLKLMERTFSRHFAPLLQESESSAQRVKTFETNLAVVRNEAMRLGRLVDDLLDLNKIESGRMQWRDQWTPLETMLRDAMVAVSGLLAGRPEVETRLELEQGLPELFVDPDRIHQILNNLLNNATKFTEKGSITLSAKRRGDAVEIQVSDTGPGIAPEDHERVFDIFYQSQAGDSRSNAPFGSGLGLAICRNIVDHYGGSIRVDSQPGSGSTFTVTLPVARAE